MKFTPSETLEFIRAGYTREEIEGLEMQAAELIADHAPAEPDPKPAVQVETHDDEPKGVSELLAELKELKQMFYKKNIEGTEAPKAKSVEEAMESLMKGIK